ncbi:MAG: hypothetical protein K2X81_15075, partial [Candidatus Obscuribacterales bacterium]|nr:hypothetical protein [Candidatus Obscuribacterales bacterium]
DAKENRTELVAMLKPRDDGKIEISEKDFDKIGLVAARILRDAGVTKLTMTPGKNSDTYEANLKKPLEIPNVHGMLKLEMGSTFKAEVIKNADGSMTLDKIEGLTFFKPTFGLSMQGKMVFNHFKDSVDKIHMRLNPDGKKSEITYSSRSWDTINKDNIRTKQAEIIEKAKILFERMEKLKSTEQPEALPPASFLEIPKLQK